MPLNAEKSSPADSMQESGKRRSVFQIMDELYVAKTQLLRGGEIGCQ